MENDKFAREFITEMDGKLPPDDLKIVMMELERFTANYDISVKSTELVPLDYKIPSFYQAYIVSKKIEGLSDGTLKIYNLILREFFESLEKPIEKVTANDIRTFLFNRQRFRQVSNRTLDNNRLVINSFFAWAMNEGYLSENPCSKVAPIKYEIKPREPLSDIELEMVRNGCESLRDKAIIETLYSTGCRVSELLILTKQDINFETKEVHLFGKGSKHRISYMNAKMEVALKRYLNSREDNDDHVFVSLIFPYKGLTKGGVEKIVREIGERSGIGRPLYPHLIRHTTATDALSRGMDIAEVQKILGHEKMDTTLIYAKVCQDDVKYAHRKYVV